MGNNDILVSVCMIAYNHEDYIGQAIESVLAQKTDFKYELIISDDVSSDNTREICYKYQKAHPDIIRLFFRETNLGICTNFFDTFSRAMGKYIAVCEGDDYWIDEYKIQKQKDYLDLHPKASMVFHNAIVGGNKHKSLFIGLDIETHVANTEELLKKWSIPTASIMFRSCSLFIPTPFKSFINADYYLEILLNSKGEIHYIPSIMSFYRKHNNSASEVLNADKVSLYNGLIELLQYCKPLYPSKDWSYFDNAVSYYAKLAKKEDRANKYPFIKYCDYRFYKRILLKILRISRTKE